MSTTTKPATSQSAPTTINSQFKHTILWNNILDNLKSELIESNAQNTQNRLRKQHSRFVAASMGGMLLIKQNIIMNTTNTLNNLTSNTNPAQTLKLSNSPLETIYFTGSQCIDIVYNYLVQNKQMFQFERQITRDKCAKLCQMIMDSGVFEPLNRSSSKFDDTSLKYFKFKSEYLKQFDPKKNNDSELQQKDKEENDEIEKLNQQIQKTDLSDHDDNYHNKLYSNDKENHDSNNNSTKNNKNLSSGSSSLSSQSSSNNILFSKSRLISKSNNVNTKLKRKLTSMRRSSTIHALMPLDAESSTPDSALNTVKSSFKQNASSFIQSDLVVAKTLSKSYTPKSSYLPTKSVKLDRTKSIDSSSYDFKIKFENKPNTQKLAQELLLTRQITRELIIEKLLSLIDLPIIEHLLTIDERNDIEYCEALQKFDSILSQSQLRSKTSADDQLDKLLSKSNLSLIQRSLSCLSQTYDLSKCDVKEEWRMSVLDCLEFIDWERLITRPGSDKNLVLFLMKDIELYTLVKDHYIQKHKNSFYFLDDSFQPLFANILVFIKKSHYSKALEILNLGTLLLLKQTQAELKRLLKFLYITANSSHAPRLCEEKPNNSIILNHFASCLINSKLIGFEESRLLLNFMLNNFDNLFRLNKGIEESIAKRRLLAQTCGKEEALIEKVYCKRVSKEEYVDSAKEQTTKALVDLINHIIDDPAISLKQKKLKLKALQRIHPDVYEKYFSDLF